MKQQDNCKRLQCTPAIRDANDARGHFTQVQGGKSKRLRGLYMKLTPVQQAQITKYSLADDNEVAILRCTVESQTVIMMSSVSTSLMVPAHVLA